MTTYLTLLNSFNSSCCWRVFGILSLFSLIGFNRPYNRYMTTYLTLLNSFNSSCCWHVFDILSLFSLIGFNRPYNRYMTTYLTLLNSFNSSCCWHVFDILSLFSLIGFNRPYNRYMTTYLTLLNSFTWKPSDSFWIHNCDEIIYGDTLGCRCYSRQLIGRAPQEFNQQSQPLLLLLKSERPRGNF